MLAGCCCRRRFSFSTQFQVHDWMNLMVSDDLLRAICNLLWNFSFQYFMSFNISTTRNFYSIFSAFSSRWKQINLTISSQLASSFTNVFVFDGNLMHKPRETFSLKIKFMSLTSFLSFPRSLVRLLACVYVSFFSSSRAYKSNQQENNAPLDTTHIKKHFFFSSSVVGLVWTILSTESMAQQTAKQLRREGGENIS